MKVSHGLEQVSGIARSVLSVGNFDGVHLAHQHIVQRGGELAAGAAIPMIVLTFEPHPLTVVAPGKAPPRLCSPEEKIQLLAQAGADMVVIARSEPSLLHMDAEDFIRDVLVARFHPAHMVEGPSFGFGRGRKGTPQLLLKEMKRFDCTVHIVEPVTLRGAQGEQLLVSSSLIRSFLAHGDVGQAAHCLGRPYALEGTVIRGAGRGRSIGVPTANLRVAEDRMVPQDAVYAGTSWLDRKAFPAAISVGPAATFGGSERQIEVHLLGFEGDLYGRLLRIEFTHRIRGQEKFASATELVGQIRRDLLTVEKLTPAP